MKLSIITINRNNAEGLRMTMESVLKQTYHNIEYIVVDGASTDGSVEIIKDYVDKVERVNDERMKVVWSSEPDKGIYNAMNKGIRKATGDYIQILNSGDILASNHVLADCCLQMDKLGFPEFLYGNMIKKDYTTGKIVGKSGEVPYSLLQYFVSTMNHDCCWIKRSLFVNNNANKNIVGVGVGGGVGVSKSYGLYDEDLRIVSDWKWSLQAIGLGKVRPVYVDVDMTIFDISGISEQNLSLRYEERRRVLADVLPPAVFADYDRHAFDMQQMDNLRKHPWAYKLVWTLERVLNRVDNKNFKKPKKK